MDIVKTFLDKCLKEAPWPEMQSDDFPGMKFKYPYKHFLLISIIEAYRCIPFGQKVDYKLIAKNFYDLLTSDSRIVNTFVKSKSKGDWNPGIWNEKLQNSVISLIKRMPAKMLFTYYSKNHSDTNLYSFDNKEMIFKNPTKLTGMLDQELSDVIKERCIQRLKICLPHNPSFNDAESIKMLMNTKQFMSWLLNEMTENRIDIKEKGRDHQLQSLWRKALIDTRGAKCQVCDTPYPVNHLEAAHIKQQSKCKTNEEKFDESNGMLMCPNHHTFYDKGSWSIKDGKTIACDHLTDPFNDGTNFEPSLKGKEITTDSQMLSYFKWHYDNIYKCKEKH